jgi:hypothetical protein
MDYERSVCCAELDSKTFTFTGGLYSGDIREYSAIIASVVRASNTGV